MIVCFIGCHNAFGQTNDTIPTRATKDSIPSNAIDSLKSNTPNLVKDTIQSIKTVSIACTFNEKNILLGQVTAISNLLKIINNTAESYSFSISIKSPSLWRNLFENNRVIVIKAGDSVFLPVRLLTSSNKIKSGIKLQFIALIKNLNTFEIYKPSFTAYKEKFTQMKLDVSPGRDIYFRNNENTANFKINLQNNGDYEEKFMLKIDKIGKNIFLKDSNGIFSKRNYNEYTLKPFQDTTIPVSASVYETPRNLRRVDTYGYNLKPSSIFERSLLFIRGYDLQTLGNYTTTLANGKDTVIRDVFKVGKSVRLIKLGDTKNLDFQNQPGIPLTLVANAFNLINYQPSLNILLFGNKNVDKYGSFNYFLQTNFNYYNFSNQTTQATFGLLTFNNKRIGLMVGNGVRLNLPLNPIGTQVSGTGISSTYHINNKNSVGVAISRNGRNLNSFSSTNLTMGYGGTAGNFKYGLGFLNTNFQNGNNILLFSGTVNYKINKYHYLSLFGGIFNFRFLNVNRQGNILGGTYNINYLKNKAQSTLSFIYNELPFSAFNPLINVPVSNANLNITLNNFYRIKKSTLSSNSNYMLMPSYNFSNNNFFNNTFINNNIIYSRSTLYPVKLNPGAYFNYTNIFNQEILSGGALLNLLYFNLEENFRLNINSRGGYNRVINNPDLPNFFTAQISAFMSYRVWRLNVRYFYGPQFFNNITSILTNQQRYNQIVFANITHQYQFKNKHFIWENTFMYNYINVNRRNGLGLFSQLNFFAYNGWNFNLNCNINYNIADALLYTGFGNNQSQISVQPTDERRESYFFQLGLGVKKDFSIQLPQKYIKKKSGVLVFKAFLDINGNRIFDKDEIELPNVVIKVDDDEIQTNKTGEATLTNLKFGKYGLTVFPIEDIGPWFCVIKDTLNYFGQEKHFIPFSKGAQVSGNVEIERSESGKTFFSNLDISRFTLILSDSAGFTHKALTDNKGFFSFYVPYGKYTLRFNENMLGKEFSLNDNDIEIDLNPSENSFYHSFIIIEKQKKVKKKRFDSEGNLLKDE